MKTKGLQLLNSLCERMLMTTFQHGRGWDDGQVFGPEYSFKKLSNQIWNRSLMILTFITSIPPHPSHCKVHFTVSSIKMHQPKTPDRKNCCTLQRLNFWSRNRELKPVYFPVSSCFLPGICSLAIRGIFGRLPRFLPGFSSLSCFLPVLKRGLGSRFRLVLWKVVTVSRSPIRKRDHFQ